MKRLLSLSLRRFQRSDEVIQGGSLIGKSTADSIPVKDQVSSASHSQKFNDIYCKHQQKVAFSYWPLKKSIPKIQVNVFVAPCALISGNVEIWSNSSVWYGCVIRGDVNLIRIGTDTNIQDGTVIQEALQPLDEDHDGSTIIGHEVTIGHGCFLRACTIEDQCLVGMGSTLEEGSYMERNSILGANSLLTRGSRIPNGQLWMGNPAKFARNLTESELMNLPMQAKHYIVLAQKHFDEFYLPSHAYLDAERKGIEVGFKEY